MNLPSFILTYCASILKSHKYSCTALSLMNLYSHDFLTRGLLKKYGWKEILFSFLKEVGDKYYLIVDETDHDKRYGVFLQNGYWYHSHKERKALFGYQLVVLAITDGKKKFPIAWKIYDPTNGKSKQDLGLELMVEVLGMGHHPIAFLFDAAYASEKILRFLISHQQVFYTQVPKNRLFNGIQLKKQNKNRPYWMSEGELKGHIHVQLIKNRRKYFITNAIGCSREKHLATYKIRWRIEEIFRSCKGNFGMGKCQSQSMRSQHNHVGACFTLFCILQVLSEKTQMSDYALKQKASLNHQFADSLLNSISFAYA